VNVGELSPLQSRDMASRHVNVRIVSPWGLFPPYEVSARVIASPDPDSGNISPEDYGVGARTNANHAVIDPQFDYDPSLVSKDIDDRPRFLGTLDTLGPGLPRTPIYRTTRFQRGQSHVMRLTFAVGPQFFTPTDAEIITIEIAVAIV